jgi:flagellar FliL protein
MSEMRTMASTATATRTGSSASGKAGAADDGAEAKKGGKKKVLLLAVVVVLVGAGAAWWFLFRGGSADATAKAKPAPVPGEVLTADAISINLADGHYLKLGLALQEVKGATEVTDPSKALDAAITLYSTKPMSALSDPTSRDQLKKELVATVSKAYDEQVYDVYFTEYVMQ